MTSTNDQATDAIAQLLLDLAQRDRRARLLALMPVIHDLCRRGVRQQLLASTLTDAGIPITAVALRKSLSRWRRRSPEPAGIHPTDSHQPAPPTTQLSATPAPHPHTGPAAITSKADLKRLRDLSDHIDLNELAEFGRKE